MLSFVSHCWVISHEKKRKKKEKEEDTWFRVRNNTNQSSLKISESTVNEYS